MVFDHLYLNKDHLDGFDNYKVSVCLLVRRCSFKYCSLSYHIDVLFSYENDIISSTGIAQLPANVNVDN